MRDFPDEISFAKIPVRERSQARDALGERFRGGSADLLSMQKSPGVSYGLRVVWGQLLLLPTTSQQKEAERPHHQGR